MKKKLCLLMILDGWGLSNIKEGNAILNAKIPNMDNILKNYPHTVISASGLNVGLPEEQMGNSEVGHLNIGAGRVIYQELSRINMEIKTGGFLKNQAFLNAVKNALYKGTKLHLIGLLSDGGVHSHIDHIKALIKLSKDNGLKDVYVHCFLDGRDVAPKSARDFIIDLEKYMEETGVGKIATISGRYYAMDRDKRWERVNLAYNALVKGQGEAAESAVEAIDISYKDNKTDEFVLPYVISENGEPRAVIGENDSVIFFNFRPDRARELTRAIADVNFSGFEREYFKTYFVTMTQYDETLENVEVAYKPESYANTLGEYLSKLGLKQLRIAETEKYAHVTFFFNGGIEPPYEGEDRILIPSPKVPTYDMKPEMSVYEVTDVLIENIKSKKYDVIIVNYANPDMVGHTGMLDAGIKAVEAVDSCVGRVVDEVLKVGGSIIITADHGNVEDMIDHVTGEKQTAHSTNPVPFIIIGEGNVKLLEGGKLSDIAPTLLAMMDIPVPEEMTGQNLII
ncbi:2,3-bisphosphoglycerate-independent phosphoglycerate mutase [Oxobacter pfennigii]|uniref:2,3-bisphosphoglycerate-independent phosphoglycerate mutase n=1 Tax=Oxobacter pfennigii TaxID=36849 RepID=A0A0P8WRM0_9CLOT|nr:2,3-bisphosphoglycerate-independent phosphoglycerate mutase [Oxobacter pfennigii]KPU45246.1 2,3-bisphosphoglycerate-independent phosphoglycerate mutase [Oxobacter pfennigii]